MTRASPKLSPMVYLPDRDALVSFLFEDISEDPLRSHGDTWCASGRASHMDTCAQDNISIPKGPHVKFAVSPGATHIAAACGARLAILGTTPLGSRENSPDTRIRTAAVCDTTNNCSEREHITAITWVGYTTPPVGEVGGEMENDSSLALELYLVIGTSLGRILIYTPSAICLMSHKLNCDSTKTSEGSEVIAIHARNYRHPFSDEYLENLSIVLDDKLFHVDAREFRSVTRKAVLWNQSAAKSMWTSKQRFILDYPLTWISLDVSKLAQVVDAACIGWQLPSLSDEALYSQRCATASQKLTQGLLTAGTWGQPRRISGIVSLIVNMKNEKSALGAAAAFATKTASSAVATVSAIFNGVIDITGTVARSIPTGRTFKGAVVGAMLTAGSVMESATVDVFAACTSSSNVSSTSLDDLMQSTSCDNSGIWCSAFVDPPRCVLGIYPAPRGSLCAIVDSLGRVILLDTSSSFLITTALVLKGCRDVELSWMDVDLPSGAHHSNLFSSTAGLGKLYLALRSPHRNQGRVEIWEIGSNGKICVEHTPNWTNVTSERALESKLDFRRVRLLQGPPLYGPLCSPLARVRALAGSPPYVLSSDGKIYEITFTA